jgi:hypothetical protein
VIFALELSDNVDPTALATVLLAVLTFATVVVGVRALRRSKDEIDLSRREVEQAHRPVLIPINDENQELLASGKAATYRAKPRYQENNRIVVPIKNIGEGPALNIIVAVGPPSWVDEPAPIDDVQWIRVVGLGVSESAQVAVYVQGLTELADFSLALTYVDVAGKTWRTSADYHLREGGIYDRISIKTVTSGTAGLEPLRSAQLD